MKYTIFLHVFNDISINAYNISLIILGISAMNSIQYYEICNTIHVAVINITNYKCVNFLKSVTFCKYLHSYNFISKGLIMK